MDFPSERDMEYGAWKHEEVSQSFNQLVELKLSKESHHVRIAGTTYEDFLGVAYPPRQILHVAVCLHDFWREVDAEPDGLFSTYKDRLGTAWSKRTESYMRDTAKTTRFAYLPSLSTKLP